MPCVLVFDTDWADIVDRKKITDFSDFGVGGCYFVVQNPLRDLEEADRTGNEMFDCSISRLAEQEGITEYLKEADQMEWV